MTRSSNVVTDAIPGVTLRLLQCLRYGGHHRRDPERRGHRRQGSGVRPGLQRAGQWVTGQFSGAGAEEGVDTPPLAGDSVLRHMRDTLKNALLSELSSAVGGTLTRFADIGVEINKHGLFEVDASKLMEALEQRPCRGPATPRGLRLRKHQRAGLRLRGERHIEPATYEVEITQAAARAQVTGTGFSGVYADDGTPDTLTVRDLGTDSTYSVSLADGMTLSQIVSALNTEFATPKAQEVQAATALYGDGAGTEATNATLLQDLHDASGTALGVADGDVLTLSGTRADGSAFLQEFQVIDVTTQTLGSLRSAVADAVGSGEEVAWQDGRLTVSSLTTGASSLSLAITSDNAGGGSLSLGAMEVTTTAGARWTSPPPTKVASSRWPTATMASSYGFEVSYTAGGADGTASFGLAAGHYAGMDVQGTIGGHAATGSGRVLTGSEDTAVGGLMIRYEGADTGCVGSMVFSRGIASAVETAANLFLGAGEGSIDGLIANIDPLVDRLNERIDNLEARLELRRENLIKKFARLEEALAMAQSQSEWLTSQLANLPKYSKGD